MIGNLVQIRPLVTQNPSRGFSKQRSDLVFFHYFAIFYINYFIITCLMPFLIIFHEKMFGLFIVRKKRPIFIFSQIRYDLWLFTQKRKELCRYDLCLLTHSIP